MTRIQMWVPIEFKAHVRKKQSQKPDKSITDILKEMIPEDERRGGGRDGAFYSRL